MKRGDHLVVQRVGYTHHGLYLGDDRVIHYAGIDDNLDKEEVEITSYEEFSQDNYTYIKNYLLREHDEEESVERACSRLGEDEYNLVFNNCEHFVTWCIQGISRSEQVEEVTKIAFEIMEKEWKEKNKDIIFHQLVRGIEQEVLIKHTVTSTIAKTAVTNAVGTTAGIATASAITGGTVAGVSTAIAAGSIATIAAPLALAAGVGYGVTKVIDWLWD